MNIGRKILLVFLTPLLSLLLFAVAFTVGMDRTIGQPDSVKKTLADSGIYGNIIPSVLSQSKEVTSSTGDVPLTDATIKSAAAAAFSPQYIQQSTEKAIDGTYAWLSGKADKPTFSIDLTEPKAAFASNVAQNIEKKVIALPACPKNTRADAFDAFNAACLPANVTPHAAGLLVQNDILKGQGFLDTPVITADSIKNGDSNQSVFNDQLKTAPTQYQRAKKAPAALILLSILTILAIVFISSTRRKGLRRVGFTLISVGVFMLIFAWALNYGVNNKLLPQIKIDNAILQTDVKKLITDLVHNINQNYQLFGGVYAALGLLAVVVPMILARRQTSIATPNHHLPANAPETAPPPANASAAYRSRPTQRPVARTARTPKSPKIQG